MESIPETNEIDTTGTPPERVIRRNSQLDPVNRLSEFAVAPLKHRGQKLKCGGLSMKFLLSRNINVVTENDIRKGYRHLIGESHVSKGFRISHGQHKNWDDTETNVAGILKGDIKHENFNFICHPIESASGRDMFTRMYGTNGSNENDENMDVDETSSVYPHEMEYTFKVPECDISDSGEASDSTDDNPICNNCFAKRNPFVKRLRNSINLREKLEDDPTYYNNLHDGRIAQSAGLMIGKTKFQDHKLQMERQKNVRLTAEYEAKLKLAQESHELVFKQLENMKELFGDDVKRKADEIFKEKQVSKDDLMR